MNFAKDFSVLQFDLNGTLAYRYRSVIKLNKIEGISLGLKIKTQYSNMYDVIYE